MTARLQPFADALGGAASALGLALIAIWSRLGITNVREAIEFVTSGAILVGAIAASFKKNPLPAIANS